MNKREFSKTYPSLSGTLCGDFQYPDDTTDEELARTLRNDLPPENRRQFFCRLLSDCDKLMSNIDSQWEILADVANRPLYAQEQARDWLARIMAVWAQSIREIEDTKSS